MLNSRVCKQNLNLNTNNKLEKEFLNVIQCKQTKKETSRNISSIGGMEENK